MLGRDGDSRHPGRFAPPPVLTPETWTLMQMSLTLLNKNKSKDGEDKLDKRL